MDSKYAIFLLFSYVIMKIILIACLRWKLFGEIRPSRDERDDAKEILQEISDRQGIFWSIAKFMLKQRIVDYILAGAFIILVILFWWN